MEIKVTNRRVRIDRKDIIHKGEYNLHKCHFNFSDEYQGLNKYAVFDNYKVSLINDECDIPDEVLKQIGKVILGVYAENEEKRYSPKPTNFDVEDGSYKGELIKLDPYTNVSDFEMLRKVLNRGRKARLIEDISAAELLTINKTSAIDLNGHTYTTTESSSSTGIKITGDNTKVTINDSVGTGKITNTLSTSSPKTIYIDNNAIMELNSGNILTDSTRIGSIIGVGDNATFIINGGIVKNNTTKTSMGVSLASNNGKVIVNGGEIINESGKVISLSVTSTFLQMNDGKLSGKQALVGYGIIEISGGEIIGTTSAISHTSSQRISIKNVTIGGEISVKDSKDFYFDETSVILNGSKHNKINVVSNDDSATKNIMTTNAEKINNSLFLAVPGDEVTISLTPNTNEQLLDFQILDNDENNIIESNSYDETTNVYTYSFTMPSSNVDAKVTYKTYKLIQKLSNGVQSNQPLEMNVVYSTIIRFEYTVENGYTLTSVKVNDEEKITTIRNNILSIGKITEDTTIEVIATKI